MVFYMDKKTELSKNNPPKKYFEVPGLYLHLEMNASTKINRDK